MDIVSASELPSWLQYPEGYRRLVEQRIFTFDPWYLLNRELAKMRFNGLRERYRNRNLFAFAARYDNDDIACWEEGKGNQVLVIHDFATDGFEKRREYSSFWDWFRAAVEDMIAFEPE